MKKFQKFLLACLAMATFGFNACTPEPTDDDEEENITTVSLIVAGNGSVKTYQWKDKDGEGGAAATIDSIKLAKNQIYTVAVNVLDESAATITDLTTEIKEKADKHLFVFTAQGGANGSLTFSGLSTDKNGKPFGQSLNFTTAATASGSLNVTLKHEPNKSAANPALTGETDIDVTFPVTIQ